VEGRTEPASAITARPVVPFDMNLRTHKRATYETLRDMIQSFELPPGERLVEKDLAARLGVSKTPVREALAMLEADGLVETTPYRGALVRWLSRNEMAEQGFLVDALEMPAYPIVVERITDAELAAIDKVGKELTRARRDRNEKRFGQLAVQIHLLLFACTGFPRLLELIRVVVGPVGLRPAELDLAAEATRVEVDGQLVDTATGAAVLGHPAEALALAVNDLATRGLAVEAGWVVLTGGMTDAVFAPAGCTVACHFTHLGSVVINCGTDLARH